jgi:hypothetical protein
VLDERTCFLRAARSEWAHAPEESRIAVSFGLGPLELARDKKRRILGYLPPNCSLDGETLTFEFNALI